MFGSSFFQMRPTTVGLSPAVPAISFLLLMLVACALLKVVVAVRSTMVQLGALTAFRDDLGFAAAPPIQTALTNPRMRYDLVFIGVDCIEVVVKHFPLGAALYRYPRAVTRE